MRPIPVEAWVVLGIAIFLIVAWFISSIRSHSKLMNLYRKAFLADMAFMDAWMRYEPRRPTPPVNPVSLKKNNTQN